MIVLNLLLLNLHSYFDAPEAFNINSSSAISSLSVDGNSSPSRFSSPVIIGFTATDEFSSQRKARDFSNVAELLPNKFFKYTIEQGINYRVLHPCKIVELELDDRINQDFRQIIKKKQKNNTHATSASGEVEISTADLELLKVDEINRVLVDFICNVRDPESNKTFKNKSGLIFAIDIDHAKSIEAEINKVLGEGHAASIHSKISKSEQVEILKKHKSGEIKLLVNVDMLTVGYDDKKLEYIIDFRPTKSTVRLIQTFGRITRKNPETEEAKTYVQLVIPKVNLQVSELMSGQKRLGEISSSAGLTSEDLSENPVETFCYYKVQFSGGVLVERAIERKNTIALIQSTKKLQASIPNQQLEIFQNDDLTVLQDVLASGNFLGEAENEGEILMPTSLAILLVMSFGGKKVNKECLKILI